MTIVKVAPVSPKLQRASNGVGVAEVGSRSEGGVVEVVSRFDG
jgi:hypothetical protein